MDKTADKFADEIPMMLELRLSSLYMDEDETT